MTGQERVRAGFVGAGGICRQKHLPALKQMPGIELAAVSNRSPESSRRAQAEWGFERAAGDWRQVVEDPAIDAVFIGTWPYRHCEISLAALAAGKHVFCQARMCMDWPEAVEMVAAAATRPNQVNMICPSPFRVRWEQTVKRVLASGEFGSLQSVQIRSLNAANCDRNQVSWREEVQYSGINVLQVGIFAETLNAWCGEYAELTAHTEVKIPEKQDAAGQSVKIEVPQVVNISGKLAGGAASGEQHSGVETGPECSAIELAGSAATLKVDLLKQQVLLIPNVPGGGPGRDARLVDDVGDPWRVEEEFIAAVRAARRGESWRVSPDFREGAAYMRKMQAIYDSAQAGRSITLADYRL